MTELSQRIVAGYQARKTKKQKNAFIELLRGFLPELKVEEAGKQKSKNLILGDVDRAQVVLAAHYDTAPMSVFPNLSMPYRSWLKLPYVFVSLAPILAVTFVAMKLLLRLRLHISPLLILTLFVYYALLFGKYFYGIANPSTLNDNTSGVITLLDTWQAMDERTRAKTAIVLFDDEEKGCVGSKAFYQLHEQAMQEKLLLNLDCVGDGDTMLLLGTEAVLERYSETLKTVFAEQEGLRVVLDSKERADYSSDHKHFPMGVGVSARRKSRLLGLYFSRIHTPWDTVLRLENVAYLTEKLRILCQNDAL